MATHNVNTNLRAWAEINLDNLAANAAQIRAAVGPKPQIMAAVKADAYGHGAVSVSGALLQSGVSQLGVATCAEGVELRENNINAPVLIFGHTPPLDFPEVIKHNLTQTVFNYEMAAQLSGLALEISGAPARIHIKIDTGMSRLGFIPGHEALLDIQRTAQLPGVYITGAYTHFADSDTNDQSFTRGQYACFTEFTDALSKAGIHIPLRHAANSGAIVGCPGVFLDMVRSGILLYGLKPSAEMDMRGVSVTPVMTLKSRVGFIKRLPPGVSVSYGRTYVTPRETLVATIPFGYADGYPRALSNRGRVLLNGRFASVIGMVCMDQLMADVTDITGAAVGQEVVLIGCQGKEEITADELAAAAGTISYEIVCGIGKRVPRLYIKNNKFVKMV
ncbi:MAG: alanine racemase [Clostridiales bacterium]|jgi:alanine racemase|nr:alanine racemase [Clostridiales bacterium]